MNRSKLAAFLFILIAGLGIISGLYVGIVWGFVGGIVQVIEAAKLDPVSAGGVAWGIFRVLAASALGTIVGWGGVLFGAFVASQAR